MDVHRLITHFGTQYDRAAAAIERLRDLEPNAPAFATHRAASRDALEESTLILAELNDGTAQLRYDLANALEEAQNRS